MLEKYWNENEYTAEGRAEHEAVHTARIERRGGNVKVYETQLYSDRLKIIGRSDCVEFSQNPAGAYIDMLQDTYSIYPVEYKHGRGRNEEEYNMQLCAQAICLEEMYGAEIDRGAIFYINAHRRAEVVFDKQLREKTEDAAGKLFDMMTEQRIPPAVFSSRCGKCSMTDICMPKLSLTAGPYMKKVRELAVGNGGEG